LGLLKTPKSRFATDEKAEFKEQNIFAFQNNYVLFLSPFGNCVKTKFILVRIGYLNFLSDRYPNKSRILTSFHTASFGEGVRRTGEVLEKVHEKRELVVVNEHLNYVESANIRRSLHKHDFALINGVKLIVNWK